MSLFSDRVIGIISGSFRWPAISGTVNDFYDSITEHLTVSFQADNLMKYAAILSKSTKIWQINCRLLTILIFKLSLIDPYMLHCGETHFSQAHNGFTSAIMNDYASFS